jgi:nicotinamidase-related amidase
MCPLLRDYGRGHPTGHAGLDIECTRAHLVTAAGGAGATLVGSNGAELVAPLAAHPGDLKVVKTRFSGFNHTNLDLLLRRMSVQHVVLCGVQTPNCIRATAVDALGLDYKVPACLPTTPPNLLCCHFSASVYPTM